MVIIVGVLIFLEASSSYLKRGITKVTFFSDTPVKWKVLCVIYVVGYPMLCAATEPMALPVGASACLNLFLT